MLTIELSQRTTTMFVRVVALRNQHHICSIDNSIYSKCIKWFSLILVNTRDYKLYRNGNFCKSSIPRSKQGIIDMNRNGNFCEGTGIF